MSDNENLVHTTENKTPNSTPSGVSPVVKRRLLQASSTPASTSKDTKKRRDVVDDDDSDEELQTDVQPEVVKTTRGRSTKRRRIIVDDDGDDDSGDEYKPDTDEVTKAEESDEAAEKDIVNSSVSDDETEATPKRSAKRISTLLKSTPSSNKSLTATPKTTPSNKSLISTPKSSPSLSTSLSLTPKSNFESKEWSHCTYEFLREDKIRDLNGRRPNDEDYDPRTLQVPNKFLDSLTPAMRQWWVMKSQHFDTVLFFKVGKFYELYHMDATIGVEQLGLVYMRGEFAHSGFPETAFSRYADSLVQKGYKVARVEQTETPQMMEQRCKNMVRASKFDKVVTREICRIVTPGTRLATSLDSQDESICTGRGSGTFLLALTQQTFCDQKSGSISSEFGVCFLNATLGQFYILQERGSLGGEILQLFSRSLSGIPKEQLKPGKEFWDAHKTIGFLREKEYFGTISVEEITAKIMGGSSNDSDMAIRCLGACLWFMDKGLIVDEVMTMATFYPLPADMVASAPTPAKMASDEVSLPPISATSMILDSVTLQNLEILKNSVGTTEGTLLATMDFCATSFGRRQFVQWLCAPSCDANVIDDRYNAVENLNASPIAVQNVTKLLKTVPDLERLCAKVHGESLPKKYLANHPDSRAILFEEVKYNKRKIAEFIVILEAFKSLRQLTELFDVCRDDMTSRVLKRCTTLDSEGGAFPDMGEALSYFDNAFDHEAARRDGRIEPVPGVSAEYDDAVDRIRTLDKELAKHLREQSAHFGANVKYVGSGRKAYQLEVPEREAVKRATDDHNLQGQIKGYRRFYTPTTQRLANEMLEAQEAKQAAAKDILRSIMAAFDEKRLLWQRCIECVAALDCLVSLATYSISCGESVCRPQIITNASKPQLVFKEARHPSLLKHLGSDVLIPNDLTLGIEDGMCNGSALAVVTGPNMGGKSTLMRQTGLLLIMAQMGSFVPASEFRYTISDRVFTRLGATDHITLGQSTFFVELLETSAILSHATPHSLVLVDELGRGTATADGAAIAYSVCCFLASTTKCRTLFSTHYHNLVQHLRGNPDVFMGHMACMVENEDDSDPTEENIVFLYKFVKGPCPKSYGFNVAKLAGLPLEIIKNGFIKAKQLEENKNSAKSV